MTISHTDTNNVNCSNIIVTAGACSTGDHETLMLLLLLINALLLPLSHHQSELELDAFPRLQRHPQLALSALRSESKDVEAYGTKYIDRLPNTWKLSCIQRQDQIWIGQNLFLDKIQSERTASPCEDFDANS